MFPLQLCAGSSNAICYQGVIALHRASKAAAAPAVKTGLVIHTGIDAAHSVSQASKLAFNARVVVAGVTNIDRSAHRCVAVNSVLRITVHG